MEIISEAKALLAVRLQRAQSVNIKSDVEETFSIRRS